MTPIATALQFAGVCGNTMNVSGLLTSISNIELQNLLIFLPMYKLLVDFA